MRIFWTTFLVYFCLGNTNGINVRTQNAVEADLDADADAEYFFDPAILGATVSGIAAVTGKIVGGDVGKQIA